MLDRMTAMISGNALAETGALLGDPARANILLALMGGRALIADEVAWHTGVSPQTTSGHLARLVEARLVAVLRQGRHREGAGGKHRGEGEQAAPGAARQGKGLAQHAKSLLEPAGGGR